MRHHMVDAPCCSNPAYSVATETEGVRLAIAQGQAVPCFGVTTSSC